MQIAFLHWLFYHDRKVWNVTAKVPNEGERSLIQRIRMKKEGLKKGWPDVQIMRAASGFHGMFIEFKTTKGKVTPEQRSIMDALIEEGYHCVVCRSFDAALEAFKGYIDGSATTPKDNQ